MYSVRYCIKSTLICLLRLVPIFKMKLRLIIISSTLSFQNLSLFSFSSYFLKCPQRTINFVANDEERLEMVELLCKASAKLRSKKTQKLITVTKWIAQIPQGFRNDYIIPYHL